MTDVLPSLRDRIDAGQLVLCLALAQARTADIPMIAAASGFDAVYVDLEHTATSFETVSLLCTGAIAAGITPLVRVPSHDHDQLTRSLDVGAMGVIVPHVESRAEAEQIADACRFPPRGHRSVAGPNPSNRYRAAPQRELLDAFDAQTTVAVMLETPDAVARADEIASVPGIDMVMLGPHDLTAEMGILGDFRNPAFIDATHAAAQACRDHDVIFGIAGIRDQELLTDLVELGLRFVSAGTDVGFMAEAAGAEVSRLRSIPVEKKGEPMSKDASTDPGTDPGTDPMAWVGSDFPGDDDLVYRLTPATVAGLEELVERTRELPRDEITREHVGHPDVDGPAREVYEELIRGRGLVVVRGLPVEGHTIEENERLFWCWLSHFGELLSNNSFGHRMVRVQQEVMPGGVQPARGTKSAAELAMHNDSSDLFSLLWIQQAEQGGESQFSSGPAAYATIEATRPDVLPILRRGFPHHRRSEQPDHQPDVTPYDVPIFSDIDGRIAINFTYSSILPALHVLGRELTPEEDEALEVLRRVLVEQQVELRMQPGDASMANNYAMCHSRSDFVDGPDPKRRRLVLRAWNEVPTEDRRLPVGREYFLMENEGGRLGYDPVPGREGRIAINDYSNVDDDLANLFKAAQVKPKLG